jgi:small subunit ribosomal protein S6
MRERLRYYELMFIISPLHSNEDEVSAIIQRIQQSIEAAGGEVSSINHSHPWGRRKLAYPIRAYAGGEASRRNFTEGYYVLMHFTLASVNVIEVDRTLKLTDAILRFLITSIEEPRDEDEDEDENDDTLDETGNGHEPEHNEDRHDDEKENHTDQETNNAEEHEQNDVE